MVFSQSWLQSASGGTQGSHASTRAEQFQMNRQYFATFELAMQDVVPVAASLRTQQRLGFWPFAGQF